VSVTVLQRLNREGHGARVLQELALRLWERNRFAEVVDLLKDVNSADKKHDSQLLAVHAASLMHVGQAESADAVAKALEQREDDVIAKAWLLVLRQMMGTENLNARELVDACRAALDEQAGNTYLMQFLGEGYAHLGESDLAIGAWRSAAEQNLTWVVPVVRLANVLLDTGRYDSAMAMAQEAIRRAPDNALAAITLARVWSACMENGRIGQPAELLAYVQQIRTLIPQDEQALSIEVSTLAHLGKKPEAAAVVQKALDGEHKLSSQTLLRLAAMSQRWELGVENALFDRCERDYGITPDLSYGRAIGALAAGSCIASR
jgi:tetratricopeptide (TPR) repeat protein